MRRDQDQRWPSVPSGDPTMRILIATHYWRPHCGGIETVAWEQARRLVRLGHEVTVVTSKLSGDESFSTEEGVDVHRVAALNLLERRSVPFPIFSPVLWTLLFRLAKSHDVALVHSHTFLSSVAVAMMGAWRGLPVVVLQHNTYVEYGWPWRFVESLADLILGRLTFRLARRCLAISKESRRYAERLGAGPNVTVLYNGADLTRFRPVESCDERASIRRRLGLPIDGFVVLSVRRLVLKNGVDSLIGAAEALRDSGSLYFVIGGSGPDAPVLRDMISRKRLSNVSLTGFIPDEDLPDYYKASDIFVLPSASGEGLGLVVLEAFASGVPVVATTAGGQVDVVLERQTGMLVSPNSPHELADAIERCASGRQRTLQMGAAARRFVESLSWDTQVERLCAYLQEAAR